MLTSESHRASGPLAGFRVVDFSENMAGPFGTMILAVVVSLDEVAKEPQGVANEALEVFEHPVLGPIRQPNPVPRFADVEPRNLRPAPRLGEHTREILGEIGVSSSDLRAMELAGAALHADAMDEAVL